MHVREIEAMLRKGRPFGEIEDRIEELPLDADVKSVLWLWAWTRQSPDGQRAVVDEMLDALAA
jgi:hypothetical protein